MILILQIAAGIVLGFLILQNLPRILHLMNRLWRVVLIVGVLAGLIVLGFVLASSGHGGEDVAAIVGVLVMVVVLMLVIQYSARGLGYLYVSQRARIARSRRWTNLFRMIGVHPSWHTANLPRAEIATKVGDAVFMGLWKFLALYFIASMLVLIAMAVALKTMPVFDNSAHPWVVVLWIVAALVPGVLLFLWIGRRLVPEPQDNATGGCAMSCSSRLV